jgi:carbon-monoxide dehydrogenase small subunit
MTAIELTVNGRSVKAEVAPRTHLADFLREQLLLTGTHIGCEHGICGACTVEIDGEIARSCITYAVTCDAASIRTIEAFDDDELMGRLRQAFSAEHALQCGYCTPGMLIAARDLIRRKSGLGSAEIRTEMSGNLCRCTGYVGIVRAIGRVMADRAPLSATTVQSAAEARWLGPAPGPKASTFPQSGRAAAPIRAGVRSDAGAAPAKSPAPAASSSGAPAKRRRIKVEVGQPREADGATLLTQSFVLEHPRDAVWRIMADLKSVAACMPGLVVDGPFDGGRVTGRMEVALGPIKASFAGEGEVTTYDGEYRQMITGRGGDRKSGSNASGSVTYALRPEAVSSGGDATRVDVEMSYSLTGPLAQFGRSNLVRDLVSRIGEAFAQNLDARLLAPEGAEIVHAKLGVFSLLGSMLAGRIRDILARLVGRKVE